MSGVRFPGERSGPWAARLGAADRRVCLLNETRIARISSGSTGRGLRGFPLDQRDADYADFLPVNETRISRISSWSRDADCADFALNYETRITRIFLPVTGRRLRGSPLGYKARIARIPSGSRDADHANLHSRS